MECPLVKSRNQEFGAQIDVVMSWQLGGWAPLTSIAHDSRPTTGCKDSRVEQAMSQKYSIGNLTLSTTISPAFEEHVVFLEEQWQEEIFRR